MNIEIACPHCHEPLRVPSLSQGKRIVCPKCRKQSRVPRISAPTGRATLTAELVPEPHRPGLGFGIASMVLGIVGVVFSCVPIIGIIPSILGLVFGLITMRMPRGRGFATAGIVLGICGIVFSICIFIASLFLPAGNNGSDLDSEEALTKPTAIARLELLQ